MLECDACVHVFSGQSKYDSSMYVTNYAGSKMGKQRWKKDLSRLPSQWQKEEVWQQNVKT